MSTLKKLLAAFALIISTAGATIHYVDGNISSGGNGSSWGAAWKTLGAMTGLAAGDSVQISGGGPAASITYTLTGEFTSLGGFSSGTSGNLIIYQIGQDGTHGGTAIFHQSGSVGQFLFGGNYYAISGDAGDGLRHFKLDNYYQLLTLASNTDVRASYVDMGTGGAFGAINPGANIEFDHNLLNSTDSGLDRAFYAEIDQGTAYDLSKIHDNVMLIPYTSGGLGADGFQLVGSGGWSLYNNTVTGYNGGGINHQDGWQGSGGSYLKIYNNRFTDMQNYAIFAEGYTVSQTYNHVKVYNNICINTSGAGTQAIALSGSPTYPATDMICVNNLAEGYAGNSFTFHWTGGTNPTAFIGCYFYNNTTVNGASNDIDGAITQATNVSVSAANAPSYFTSWTANSPNNIYTLKVGAAPLIHTGTDATALGVSFDFTGTPYANPPSVGPYEYSAGAGSGNSKVLGLVTVSGKVTIK